jgi:hypothetical protein
LLYGPAWGADATDGALLLYYRLDASGVFPIEVNCRIASEQRRLQLALLDALAELRGGEAQETRFIGFDGRNWRDDPLIPLLKEIERRASQRIQRYRWNAQPMIRDAIWEMIAQLRPGDAWPAWAHGLGLEATEIRDTLEALAPIVVENLTCPRFDGDLQSKGGRMWVSHEQRLVQRAIAAVVGNLADAIQEAWARARAAKLDPFRIVLLGIEEGALGLVEQGWPAEEALRREPRLARLIRNIAQEPNRDMSDKAMDWEQLRQDLLETVERERAPLDASAPDVVVFVRGELDSNLYDLLQRSTVGKLGAIVIRRGNESWVRRAKDDGVIVLTGVDLNRRSFGTTESALLDERSGRITRDPRKREIGCAIGYSRLEAMREAERQLARVWASADPRYQVPQPNDRGLGFWAKVFRPADISDAKNLGASGIAVDAESLFWDMVNDADGETSQRQAEAVEADLSAEARQGEDSNRPLHREIRARFSKVLGEASHCGLRVSIGLPTLSAEALTCIVDELRQATENHTSVDRVRVVVSLPRMRTESGATAAVARLRTLIGAAGGGGEGTLFEVWVKTREPLSAKRIAEVVAIEGVAGITLETGPLMAHHASMVLQELRKAKHCGHKSLALETNEADFHYVAAALSEGAPGEQETATPVKVDLVGRGGEIPAERLTLAHTRSDDLQAALRRELVATGPYASRRSALTLSGDVESEVTPELRACRGPLRHHAEARIQRLVTPYAPYRGWSMSPPRRQRAGLGSNSLSNPWRKTPTGGR